MSDASPPAPNRRPLIIAGIAVLILVIAVSGFLIIRSRTSPAPALSGSGAGAIMTSQPQALHKVSGATNTPVAHLESHHENAESVDIPIGPDVAKQAAPALDMPLAPPAAAAAPVAPKAQLAAYMGPPTDNLSVVKNTPLTAAMGGNNGEETSLAGNATATLVVSNWRAGVSVDGGSTFTGLDPTAVFPSTGAGFCCDQVAHYIPTIDRFVWVLQYKVDASGENFYRIAWASTADMVSSKGTAWTYVDATSASLGIPAQWMDYPDVSFDSGGLLLTAAVVNKGSGGVSGRQMLMRLGFTDMTAGTGSVSWAFLIYADKYVYNFRIVENSGSRAFWASHLNSSSMRIFWWDFGDSQYHWNDVTVGSWKYPDFAATKTKGGTDWVDPSLTPDGQNWLFVTGSRVMGGTLAGKDLWFAWSAAKDSVYPTAHIEIARINVDTLALDGQEALWNKSYAFTMPALATNSDGEVGATFGWGGEGKYYPNMGVAILTGDRQGVSTTTSNAGTQYWGDYVTVHRFAPDGSLFAAVAYGVVSTGDPKNPVRADTRYVLFGRASHTYTPKPIFPVETPTPLTPAPIAATPVPVVTVPPGTPIFRVRVSAAPGASASGTPAVCVDDTHCSYTCLSASDPAGALTVTVANTGNVAAHWIVSTTDKDPGSAHPWFSASADSGDLAPGASASVTLNTNPSDGSHAFCYDVGNANSPSVPMDFHADFTYDDGTTAHTGGTTITYTITPPFVPH